MAKISGKITLLKDSKVYVSAVAPPNPVENQLWLDTSDGKTDLKYWNGTEWILVTEDNADMEDIREIIESHTTALDIVDGKITQLISDTTIVKEDGVTVSLKDAYNATVSTVDGISTTIGQHESKFNEVTGKVEEVESRVATTEQNLEGFKTTVSQTYTAKTDFNNLSVGGRNLLKNTNIEASNNNYVVNKYKPTELFEVGKTYTISICITPANGVTHVSPYVSTGYTKLITLYTNGKDKQVLKGTFEFTGYSTGRVPTSIENENAFIQLIRFPNDGTVTTNTTIHWVKLEKGNKATDWTPAPEDVDSELDALGGRIETTENNYSSLSQTLDGFKSEVGKSYSTKTELEAVDGKFKNYSTTTEVKSLIEASVDEIELSVSQNYTTKEESGTISNELNTAVSGVSVHYYLSTSKTELVGGVWVADKAPDWQEGKFMWSKTVTTLKNGNTLSSIPTCIAGATGEKGESGNGISSITEYYLATSLNTGVTTSTSGWTTDIQKMTATNKYLWNYEVIQYTSGSQQTTPKIIGVYGDKGVAGDTGNGISAVVNYYLATASASGVTTSTSGWTESVQNVTTAKKYLWNYEVVKYTNGNSSTSTPCIIGVYGDKGDTGASAKSLDLYASKYAVAFNASGTAKDSTAITLTAVQQNFSDTITWTTSPTVTLSGTGNTRTLAVSAFNSNNEVKITISAGDFSDTVAIVKVQDGVKGESGSDGADGEDAYTIILTNEAQSIPTNASRVPFSSTTYATSILAYKGGVSITPTVGTIASANGITASVNGATINFTTSTSTAITADSGTFTIPITIDGKSFIKTFSWSCSKQGATGDKGDKGDTGASAKSLDLYATKYAVAFDSSGTAKDSTAITLTAVQQNYTDAITWSTSPSVALGGSGLTRTLPVTAFNSNNEIKVTITAGSLSDTISIVKVQDGAKGSQGASGADGADGADAYTIILTNEAQVIPTNPSRVPSSSTTYTADVIAYKGATAVAPTIGSIASANGITVSVSGTRISLSVSTGTAISADSGTFTVPITVDGKSFSKTLSWSCSKQGVQGDTGASGVSATNVICGKETHALSCTTERVTTGASTIEIPFAGYIGTSRTACTVSYGTLPSGITLGSNTGATTGADGKLVLNVASGANLGGTSTTYDTVEIQLTFTANSLNFTKKLAITKAVAGASGSDGSNGTSATNVICGNEAHTIACTTGRVATTSSSITIPFAGYLGTSRVATTVSYGTLPSGVTLGSNAGATTSADGRLILNVASGATLGGTTTAYDTVFIPLTFTANGMSFVKNLTITKAVAGATGATGTGVSSITAEFAINSDKNNPPTEGDNAWSTEAPPWSSGKYLWTRSKIVYSNPVKTEYTTPVCDSSWEAVNDIEVGGRNYFGKSLAKFENGSFEDGVFTASDADTRDTLSLKVQQYTDTAYITGTQLTIQNVQSNTRIIFPVSQIVETCTIIRIANNGLTKEFSIKIPNRFNVGDEFVVSLDVLDNTVGSCKLTNIKIEKGNKATDWTPAPEDTEEQISILESSIKVNADNIALKVNKDGIINAINVSTEGVSINASKINLTGYVTVSSLGSSGTTIVDGGRITTGIIKDSNSNMTINLSTGAITAKKLSISSTNFTLTESGVITATSGTIAGWSLTSSAIYKNSSTMGSYGGMYFGTNGLSISDKFKVTSSGSLTATSGLIGGWTVTDSSITSDYTSLYSDGTIRVNDASDAKAYSYLRRGEFYSQGKDNDNYKSIWIRTGAIDCQRTDNATYKNRTVITSDIMYMYDKSNNFFVGFNSIDRTAYFQTDICFPSANAGIYMGSEYILKEHGNGNVTVNGFGGYLRLGHINTSYIHFASPVTAFSMINDKYIYFTNSDGVSQWQIGLSLANNAHVFSQNNYTGTLAVGHINNGSTKIYGNGGLLWVHSNLYYDGGYMVINNGTSYRVKNTSGGDVELFGLTSSNNTIVGSASYVTVLRGSSVRLTSTTGTVVTSDERLKKDMKSLSLDERYDNFFMSVDTKRFKYIEGTSDRFHLGVSAQEVKAELQRNGLSTQDFGGYVEEEYSDDLHCGDSGIQKRIKDDDDKIKGIIYTEFIPLTMSATQKNRRLINELFSIIDSLKAEIEELKKQ